MDLEAGFPENNPEQEEIRRHYKVIPLTIPTDEEQFISDLLKNNWGETTLGFKPGFFYDDTWKEGDMLRGIVKVYYVSSPRIQWRGLGATAKKSEFRISVDFRARSRERALTMRDEIVRILDANTIRPQVGTLAIRYDYLEYTNANKIANYLNNYRYVMDVFLIQIARPRGTL